MNQPQKTRLKDSKILVVGGNSGIGLGAAQAFIQQGANVILVGRSKEKLENAVKSLNKPDQVHFIVADVTNEKNVKGMYSKVGPFDHLVVTSGLPPVDAPIGDFDLNEVRGFIDLMLVSAISLVKHSQGRLTKGGSITFTTGISKDKPPIPGVAVVAAVAGSFSYLVRQLAQELAPTRVNVVSPGWVKTPMWDVIAGDHKTKLWEEMAPRLPAGRIAIPADIAHAYVYLIESEFTTGTTLDIDGGHSLI